MSYKQEIKDKVADLIKEDEESFKDFMTEHVVPMIADTIGRNTAVVDVTLLRQENINPDRFVSWLSTTDVGVSYKGDGVFIEITI